MEENKKIFELFPFQIDILKSIADYRYTLINCSRRVGKSHAMTVISILKCLARPNQHVLIVSPTQSMTVNTFWKVLLDFIIDIRPMPIPQVMEKQIKFSNGSTISLGSVDKPSRLRGLAPNPNLIVIDEFSYVRGNQAEEIFEETLKPYTTVAEANCKICVISTPRGYNYFQKLCGVANDPLNTDWNLIKFDCYSARPDNKELYDKERSEMDEKRFKQEYLCEFMSEGNQVFLNFDPVLNLSSDITDEKEDEHLVIGLDQNAGLMSCIITRVKPDGQDNKIEVINEYEGRFKDVPGLISGLKELYPKNRITICPDASMAARSAAAGIGNDSIRQLKNAGFHIRMDKKNPGILDRVNVVNAMFLSGGGKRLIQIHPRCHKLIDAIQAATWSNSTGNTLVKDNVTDHLVDASNYLFWQFRTRKSSISTLVNYNTF